MRSDPPCSSVSRNLSGAAPPSPGKPEISASITLDDAKPLYLEFEAAGVIFHQNLRTKPWGTRTLIVHDPDGNLTLFAGREV